ncbi:NADP-dependent oxidoreductase [Streptomyces niveiscabiei]|uniref:NADP-dependent oxidoreductase n=1 Tax=Streptomyces niveiscabiei TaxID=164115 RepID=UPI0029A6417B|nr:NADP-dependent oxidoreductase [Streptomyces niveiscabiei]MDX3384750.1 NADP-dependent oxidoreductase [Streptomyces niveiscabiei]
MSKAYVFTRHGGPETQALIDVDRPAPGPGELLIAVRAAGVNPVDWKLRAGLRRPGDPAERVFPAVLGSEASGVVTALGAGVTGFAVGDEVFGATLTGGYAEETLLPVAIAAHKPAALSFADAATLPVAAATAYDGVHQLALPAGATLLITGAGGGVGVAAVQIARALGLRTVGVASAAKKEFLESLGALHVPSGPDWASRVPVTVDAVYDLVGGEVLEQAAGLVSGPGRLITAGASEEAVAALGGARVTRARNAAVLEAVAGLVVRGDLDPYVTARYSLDDAGEALRAVEEGHARGKVVIEIGGAA